MTGGVRQLTAEHCPEQTTHEKNQMKSTGLGLFMRQAMILLNSSTFYMKHKVRHDRGCTNP